MRNNCLDFPSGSIFQISSPIDDLLAALIKGIQKSHHVAWGMEVNEVLIQRTPDFGSANRFLVHSPVLVKKKKSEDLHHQYLFPGNPEADEILTNIMIKKLRKVGINSDIEVSFDKTYGKVRTKKITYRGIDIRASVCPVIVKGDSRSVRFAWDVGVGNSTGIGFGALR